MEVLLLIYNLLLQILYCVPVVYAWILFQHTRNYLYLYITGLFFFYSVENVIIFITDFDSTFAKFYDTTFMSVPTDNYFCCRSPVSAPDYGLHLKGNRQLSLAGPPGPYHPLHAVYPHDEGQRHEGVYLLYSLSDFFVFNRYLWNETAEIPPGTL